MLTMLFVDDDVDLREVMKVSIAKLGHQCLTAASLSEVQQSKDAVLKCSIAILDINLGSQAPSGLHVFGWLRLNGFRGDIVFLTGHAGDDPRVMEAAKFLRARIYSKPISPGLLSEILSGGAR